MMGEYQQREIVRLRAELQTTDERSRVFQKDVERLTERYRCFQAEAAEQFAEDHAIIERLKAIIEEHRLMYCKDVGNLQAEVERLKKIAVGGYTVSKFQVEIERLKEAFRRLSYTSEQRGITIEKLKAEVEKLEDAWT